MPLRDHFRPPLDDLRYWESFHATWPEPLEIGRSLPTMPLWLADNLAVPLELNESYEESCNILGIP